MYYRKVYGESKADACPFCQRQAVAQNPQQVPVCLSHKSEPLPDMKCACGKWLDIRSGKWGPYFNCMRCGNINFRKGLDMNPPIVLKTQTTPAGPLKGESEKPAAAHQQQQQQPAYKPKPSEKRKEIVVRSDELDFL